MIRLHLIWEIVYNTMVLFMASSGNDRVKEFCRPGHTLDIRSFTCLYASKSRKSWFVAWNICSSTNGGREKNIPGRLARVDSGPIRDTVRKFSEYVPGSYQNYWIGLHYTQYFGYRWQSFPHDEPNPTFFFFANSSLKDPYRPHVSQKFMYWYEHPERDGRGNLLLYPFVCQYDALSAAAEMVCPLPLIMDVPDYYFIISAKFNYKQFDVVEWHRPLREKPVAKCTPAKCRSVVEGYTAELIEGGTRMSYELNNRPPSGVWWFHIIKEMDIEGPAIGFKETCHDINFFTPPTDVKCKYIPLPHNNQMNMSCVTAKVFPEAACNWTFIDSNLSRQPMGHRILKFSYKDLLYTMEGRVYYTSKCSILFEAKPNYKLFIVRIYPKIKRISPSSMEVAVRSISLKVNSSDIHDIMPEQLKGALDYRLEVEERSTIDQAFVIVAIVLAVLILILILALVGYFISTTWEKRDQKVQYENHRCEVMHMRHTQIMSTGTSDGQAEP